MLSRALRTAAIAAGATLFLSACASTSKYSDASTVSGQVGSGLKWADFVRLAENTTDEVTGSPQIVKATENFSKKPILMVGSIRNNTNDENLLVSDIYRQIEQRLLNTQMFRLKGANAVGEFDYALSTEITSVSGANSSRDRTVTYALTMRLTDHNGEVLGSWTPPGIRIDTN